MSDIWLRCDGLVDGPEAVEDVRARFLAGQLPPGRMSWMRGEATWQSLGKRWGASASSTPWWQVAAFLLVTLGAGILLVWELVLFGDTPEASRSVSWMQTSWALLAATIAATSIAYAVAISWREHRFPASALYMLLGTGCVLLFASSQQHMAARELALVQQAPDARVGLSRDGTRFEVEGPIGIRLLERLEKLRAAHPKVQRLVIASPGGLIDHAVDIGKWVDSNDLSVLVETDCASACVLIWAASSKRELRPTARIGLHRTSSITDTLPQLTAKRLEEVSGKEYRKLMREAGFPDRFLKAQQDTLADTIYWASPAQLVEGKMQLTVRDSDGKTVSKERLRWFGTQSRLAEDDPVRALLDELALRAPQMVDRYADKLYMATERDDRKSLDFFVEEISKELKTQLLPRGSDTEIKAWWSTARSTDGLGYRFSDPRRCTALIGMSKEDENKQSAVLYDNYIRAMTGLLRNVSPEAPVHRLTDAQFQQLGRVFRRIRETSRREAVGDSMAAEQAWSTMQSCRYSVAFHRQLDALPSSQHANMIRALEQQ